MFEYIQKQYTQLIRDVYKNMLIDRNLYKLRSGPTGKLYWVCRDCRYLLKPSESEVDAVILQYANRSKIKRMTAKQEKLRLESYYY